MAIVYNFPFYVLYFYFHRFIWGILGCIFFNYSFLFFSSSPAVKLLSRLNLSRLNNFITIINNIFITAFCSNCECSGTTQKYVSEDYKNLLKEPIVIQSVITYSLMKDYLSKKSFTDYLQGAFEKYRCSITYNDCSQRNSIKFYGKYNHEFDLFGKLASIYMVGFYLMDIAEGTDTIVNEVYRICELKRCINKFGLVYEDLSDIFY